MAKELAQRFQVPAYFIDQLIWQPGWKMLPHEDLSKKITEFLARKKWVVDGMLLRHTPQALAAADTVVFLDFPRWLCLYSVLKRQLLSYGRSRPEMHPGCPEHFDWEFLVWIWRWRERNRPGVLAALERRPPKQAFIHLENRQDLDAWLRRIHGTH